MSRPRLSLVERAARLRVFQIVALFCLVAGRAPARRPRPVITNNGPLILTGSQVCTIENATLLQHGPIQVYDQAQLIIRNSTVVFKQGYHEEYQWQFQDSAQLIVERSTINSPYTHTTAFSGSARARVDNSAFPEAFLTLTDTASVSLYKSSVRHVSIDTIGNATVQLPNLDARDTDLDQLTFWLKGTPSGTVRGLHPSQRLTWSPTELENGRISVQLTNTWVRVAHWRIGGSGQVGSGRAGQAGMASMALAHNLAMPLGLRRRGSHHPRGTAGIIQELLIKHSPRRKERQRC